MVSKTSKRKGRPNVSKIQRVGYELKDPHNRVRELRLSMGMTQENFAKHVGCSRSEISYIENSTDRKPRKFLAELIALACNVTPEYVLGTEDITSYTAMPKTPLGKQYVIVCYKIHPKDRWVSYCVCYWDNEHFRSIADNMLIGDVFTAGLITAWMPLPLCDV